MRNLEENVNLPGLARLLPTMLLIAGLLALAGTLTPPIPSQHLNNHIPAITAKLRLARPARPAWLHRGKYVLLCPAWSETELFQHKVLPVTVQAGIHLSPPC